MKIFQAIMILVTFTPIMINATTYNPVISQSFQIVNSRISCNFTSTKALYEGATFPVELCDPQASIAVKINMQKTRSVSSANSNDTKQIRFSASEGNAGAGISIAPEIGNHKASHKGSEIPFLLTKYF